MRSFVGWGDCGCCHYGVGNFGYIVVGVCDSDCCCRSSVGCWGGGWRYLGGVVDSWRLFVVDCGLEMVFDGACEAFEAFGHIRGMMGARDTAVCVFIVFMTPKECFTIAELDSGVGIELEPSTKEASFSVLGEFAKCCAFGDEVTIGRIRVKIAFELFGEGADLIVREFIRLFAGKTFEVVFGE